MAGNTSVGSIQLDVELNQQSLQKELSQLNKIFNKGFNVKDMFRASTQGIRGMRKEMDMLHKSTFNVSKAIKSVIALFTASLIAKTVKDTTLLAMSVESAMENIRRNMGASAKEFDQWVKTQSKALGMARDEAYKYGSTFSNLLGSFMDSAEETAKQTQELMKAAAIISSKTGRSYEDVSERIRSGLLGSTEAIEDLGVYVNVSMLESTKAFKKFAGDKSWNQLDYRTQQQIRLAAILEQTYARYGDTLANTTQTRHNQFIASLKNIRVALGEAFLPIWNVVLPGLTAMADAIARIVDKLAQLSRALFGLRAATAQQTEQAQATQEQAKTMEEFGKETQRTAKKIKGALADFDELHTLTFGVETAEEVESPTPIIEPFLPDQEEQFGLALSFLDKIETRLKELASLFKEGFTIGIGGLDEFNKTNEKIKESIRNIKESLKNIFTDHEVLSSIRDYENALALNLGKIAGSVVSIGQTIAANLAGGMARYLQQNENYIKERIISIFNVKTEIANIFGDLAVTLADIFSVFRSGTAQQITADIIGIFANAFLGITDLATKLGRDIVDLIATPIIQNRDKIKTAFENMLRPISTVISAIRDTVTKAFEKMNEVYDAKIRPLFESFKNGISDTFSKLLEVYNIYFAPVLDRLAQKASTVIREHLQPLLNELAELFGKVAQALKALWENWTKPFIDWIIATVLPVVAPILEAIGTLLLNLIAVAVDVAKGIIQSLGGVIDFLTAVFSFDLEKAIQAIGEIFGSIANIVETIVNTIINLFKWLYDILVGHSIIPDMVNEILGWFNNLFDWATDIVSNLVDWLIEFFTNLWDSITTKLQETWNNITNFLSETWNGIKTKATEVFDSIKTHLSETWNNLKSKAAETWENMKTSIINTVVEAKEKVGATWNNIKAHVLQRWDEIRKGIANAKNRLVDAIKEPFIIAKNWLNGIVSDAFNWGKNLIDNFIDGIKSMAHKIGDAVSNVAGGIKDLLGFSSPTKKGPGKDADKWMPNLIDMLAEGIQSNIHKVTAAASATASTIQQNVQFDAGALAAAIGASVGGAMSQALASARTTNESGYGNTEVVIKLNEIELGRAVIKSVNTVQAMAGKTLILA